MSTDPVFTRHSLDNPALERIKQVIGSDEKYFHFVKRIRKEIETTNQKGRSINIEVLFSTQSDKDIGFGVLYYSPARMRDWEKVFKEEGWVENNFSINTNSRELLYLYIKSELRSRGLGSLLFTQIIKNLQAAQVSALYAYIGDIDSKVKDFYLRRGAQLICEFPTDEEESTVSAFLKWDI